MGLISDLQRTALDESKSLTLVLRQAHVIASKLGLSEFDAWIQSELNGSFTSKPNYRFFHGQVKAYNPIHGIWVPVVFNNAELASSVSYGFIPNSIESLEHLAKSGESAQQALPVEICTLLSQISKVPFLGISLGNTNFILELDNHIIKMIVGKVRNLIVDWTLSLENSGIPDEIKIGFSVDEKTKAQAATNAVYYLFSGNNQTIIQNSEVHDSTVGVDVNVEQYYGDVSNGLADVRKELQKENLSKEQIEDAEELLKDVETKIKKKKSKGIIKAALTGLRDFLIGAGASIAATLITNLM